MLANWLGSQERLEYVWSNGYDENSVLSTLFELVLRPKARCRLASRQIHHAKTSRLSMDYMNGDGLQWPKLTEYTSFHQ